MNAKYLYVVYPGACGGNHVCNMISLCEGFGPRVHRPDYKEWLLKTYRKNNYNRQPHKYVNAHVSNDIHHIDRLYEYVDKDYALNPGHTLIIQGHIFNFFSARDYGILQELGPDYMGIVMDYPPEGSMPWQRIEAYGYHSPMRDYSFPLELYSMEKMGQDKELILDLNEENAFHLDTVKFFTPEGSQYLRELLKKHLDIELPPEADELHSEWFKWMEHVIKPENVKYWNKFMEQNERREQRTVK